MLWVPVTLAAACLQVGRTALQKSLTRELDNWSGVWVRAVFALPFLPLLAPLVLEEGGLPAVTGGFWVFCAAAAAAQMLATFYLLALFARRNFAVGTGFAKSEGVQTALLGVAVFGEAPSAWGWVGIGLGAAGVGMLIPWRRAGGGAEAWYGLGAGFFFALTAWCIRRAYGEVEAGALAAAALTLAVVVAMQAVALGGWLVGRRACGVGALSLAGSLGWYLAFALTNPAYVKTLAQVELPLAALLGGWPLARRPGAGRRWGWGRRWWGRWWWLLLEELGGGRGRGVGRRLGRVGGEFFGGGGEE